MFKNKIEKFLLLSLAFCCFLPVNSYSQSKAYLDAKAGAGRYEIGQSYESYRYSLTAADEEFNATAFKKYTALRPSESVLGLEISRIHFQFSQNEVAAIAIHFENVGGLDESKSMVSLHEELVRMFGKANRVTEVNGNDFQAEWEGERIVCILYYYYDNDGNGWTPELVFANKEMLSK